MRVQRFHADTVAKLLSKRKVATMTELKAALGTAVDVTVFRKLKELDYRTSYSHGGGYYTLAEIPQFDESGLWSCRNVHFSVHGTLLSTLDAFVGEAEAGYFVSELENRLQVGVKEALLELTRRGRVGREQILGRFLYCSPESQRRRQQILIRKQREAQPSLAGGVALGRVVPEELKAAIVLFFSLLDEKQRRLYAGLESLKFGHGGDRQIAELLGIEAHTVARGRQQLVARDIELKRVRKSGAGRKPVEKKRRR